MDFGEWDAWRREVFGDPYLVWHEGPDFTTLLELARTDPETVANRVTEGLGEEDPVAAQSIEALSDAGLAFPSAADALRAALPTATETFLVRVAQALRAVTGDETTAQSIVSVMASDVHWGARLDAAIALADFAPTPELVAALGRAVTDDVYLVRYHAANTLLRYAGDHKEISDHRDLFELISTPDEGRPKPADVTAYHEAAARLTERAQSSTQDIAWPT